jgi:hypothetical protein
MAGVGVKFRVTIGFDLHTAKAVGAVDIADMIDKELKLPTMGWAGAKRVPVRLECEDVDIEVSYRWKGEGDAGH